MLTVAQVAKDAFGLLGCEQPPYAVPSLLQRVLTDIQLVRKSIFLAAGIEKVIKQPQGFVLTPPTTVTVQAINGTVTLNSTASVPAWADGCTCNQGNSPGSQLQNQLSKTANGWQFVYPFSGPTGAVALTIYNDCVTLNSLSVSIERPVELEGFWELTPFTNPAETRSSSWGFNSSTGTYTDYGRIGDGSFPGGYPTLSSARNAATPLNYLPQFLPDYTGIPKLRLRVDPLPDQQYLMKWWERRLPNDITSLDDTTSLLVPYGVDEAIFLPLVRKALSTHPLFVANRALIATDYQTAMDTLKNLTNVEPAADFMVDTSAGF